MYLIYLICFDFCSAYLGSVCREFQDLCRYYVYEYFINKAYLYNYDTLLFVSIWVPTSTYRFLCSDWLRNFESRRPSLVLYYNYSWGLRLAGTTRQDFPTSNDFALLIEVSFVRYGSHGEYRARWRAFWRLDGDKYMNCLLIMVKVMLCSKYLRGFELKWTGMSCCSEKLKCFWSAYKNIEWISTFYDSVRRNIFSKMFLSYEKTL